MSWRISQDFWKIFSVFFLWWMEIFHHKPTVICECSCNSQDLKGNTSRCGWNGIFQLASQRAVAKVISWNGNAKMRWEKVGQMITFLLVGEKCSCIRLVTHGPSGPCRKHVNCWCVLLSLFHPVQASFVFPSWIFLCCPLTFRSFA